MLVIFGRSFVGRSCATTQTEQNKDRSKEKLMLMDRDADGSFMVFLVQLMLIDTNVIDIDFNHSCDWRSGCAVDGLYGEHILQTLFAWRLRLTMVANAVGEMFCLKGELVGLFLGARLIDRLAIYLAA